MKEDIAYENIEVEQAPAEAKHWHDYKRKVIEETPRRLEDAAKFLTGMVSISFTIFLKMDSKGFEGVDGALLAAIIIVWLASLVMAFLVIFPIPYTYHEDSYQSIKQMHEDAVRYKSLLLKVSVLTFLFALGLTGLAFFL